ncbi:MAG: phage tail sheath family protein [Crocinitomicaceae bacterium]|nr:phage tail sheath family protein [Crocinitomicaceae bacterium]
MSLDLKTPGVYIKENSLLPPSIVQISTAIPVFLGYTELSVSEPTRISSMKEFEASFGGAYQYQYDITLPAAGPELTTVKAALGSYFFYEAIQLYFANGGGPCFILSTGTHLDTIVSGDFATKMEEIEKLDEPTIIAFPEAANLLPVDYKAVTDAAFIVCDKMKDKFVLIDTPKSIDLTLSSPNTDLTAFRTSLTATNLNYGAAYFPHLETTADYQFSSNSKYANVALSTLKADGSADYQKAIDLLNAAGTVTLPPSSLMAGVYASVDRNVGVWKAPANVALQGVVKATVAISDNKQAGLNVDVNSGKSINAIRNFAGKGTVVWGARTLDGNSNEWRYISVRRLFMIAEESIKKATSQFVFEPNDAKTWVKVSGMISSYLDGLWKEGGLSGAKASDAYFVNVGLGVTMTTQDILEGKMIVQVGLAASRPAEFIVLEFSHFMNQ